ncbi:PAS domain-containing sensor histidine kinase [Leptospira sp. 96542]|nr:PAS domain-containing sensor histidine kinase [Leptospira sp. 96542]
MILFLSISAFVFLSFLIYKLLFYYHSYKKEKKLRLLLFQKNLNKSGEIENILRLKEKQYQDIYDTANSIIIRWSPNFRVHSINPYAEEFFQVRRNWAEGKDLVTELFHIPNTKSNEMKSLLWNIFHKPDEFIRLEYDVFLENQDRRTISWSNRILKNEFGFPYEVLSIGNDITNRKIAEENLMKSYERILDLYNNAPCGYHSLDSEGKIVSINDTELSWLGYSREEVIGVLSFSDLLAEESRNFYNHMYESFFSDGNMTGIELEYVRKDSSRFYVSLNSTATYDKEGNFVISKSTVFDVTERKLAEDILNDYSQKIEQQNKSLQKAVEDANLANKSKSIFFSKITHELRTPLHAVIGFSQILGKDPNLPEHLKGYVNSLYENGIHLLGMINDILDLSKIESGKMTEFKESFSLPQLWDSLFSMFAYRFLEKSIEFELLNPESILNKYYLGDIQKIRQVLINLIGNAYKFTNVGKVTLEINVKEKKDLPFEIVEFVVTDSGIGIPTDQLGLIFEAFQQTEQGSSYQAGTGLGLSISHQLVEFLGGTIFVYSELGKGSKFSIELPLSRITNDHKNHISNLGPTKTSELKQIKNEAENDESIIVNFLNSIPVHRKSEILRLIHIQNFGSLIQVLENINSAHSGRILLIQKVKDKRFKFLIDLLHLVNSS